jgi:ERCC4-type nuclease
MNIKIDNRETDLIQLCQSELAKELSKEMAKVLAKPRESIKNKDSKKDKNNITIEVLPLPIGDIILEYLGKEIIIIERKSAADLEASIKDGRYEEQSFRLSNSEVHNHNIVYLIEGSLINRQNKQMLYSSMFSLNYSKGFSVLRSTSIQETAYIICNMAYKLNKNMLENKLSYYKNKDIKQEIKQETNESSILECTVDLKDDNDVDKTDENEHIETSYCSVVKKVKKDNITPENISEIMLCQIPGISSVSAIAIMSQFKTMQNLISSMKADPLCLNSITCMNSKGQSRKLGKNIIANIIKFLL